jgi:hypothetical protein
MIQLSKLNSREGRQNERAGKGLYANLSFRLLGSRNNELHLMPAAPHPHLEQGSPLLADRGEHIEKLLCQKRLRFVADSLVIRIVVFRVQPVQREGGESGRLALHEVSGVSWISPDAHSLVIYRPWSSKDGRVREANGALSGAVVATATNISTAPCEEKKLATTWYSRICHDLVRMQALTVEMCDWSLLAAAEEPLASWVLKQQLSRPRRLSDHGARIRIADLPGPPAVAHPVKSSLPSFGTRRRVFFVAISCTAVALTSAKQHACIDATQQHHKPKAHSTGPGIRQHCPADYTSLPSLLHLQHAQTGSGDREVCRTGNRP